MSTDPNRHQPHLGARDATTGASLPFQKDRYQSGTSARMHGTKFRPASATPFNLYGQPLIPERVAPRDYEALYPDNDPVYHECAPNGRVWQVYNAEAELFDSELVTEASVALDSTLIFAALFASVLTTFVAQTSQSLPRDNASLSVDVLVELTLLMRSQMNGATASAIPAVNIHPPADSMIVLVNGLWFASLILSLATALFAVIAKQWLRQYISRIIGLNPRERAVTHQWRIMGLETWRVRSLIGLLPNFLHFAVLLFLAGLCIYLQAVHAGIAVMAAIVSILVVIAYLFFLITPIFVSNCPYRVPFTDILKYILGHVFLLLAWPILLAGFTEQFNHLKEWSRTRWADDEHQRTTKAMDDLVLSSILWICRSTSNTSAHRIAQQSLGAAHALTADTAQIHAHIWQNTYGNAGPLLDLAAFSAEQIFKQAERWLRVWKRLNNLGAALHMPVSLISDLVQRVSTADTSPEFDIRLGYIIPRTYYDLLDESITLSGRSTTLANIPELILEIGRNTTLPRAPRFVWEHLYAHYNIPAPENPVEPFIQFAAKVLAEKSNKNNKWADSPTSSSLDITPLEQFLYDKLEKRGWFSVLRVRELAMTRHHARMKEHQKRRELGAELSEHSTPRPALLAPDATGRTWNVVRDIAGFWSRIAHESRIQRRNHTPDTEKADHSQTENLNRLEVPPKDLSTQQTANKAPRGRIGEYRVRVEPPGFPADAEPSTPIAQNVQAMRSDATEPVRRHISGQDHPVPFRIAPSDSTNKRLGHSQDAVPPSTADPEGAVGMQAGAVLASAHPGRAQRRSSLPSGSRRGAGVGGADEMGRAGSGPGIAPPDPPAPSAPPPSGRRSRRRGPVFVDVGEREDVDAAGMSAVNGQKQLNARSDRPNASLSSRSQARQ